jgi:hypothetical protein
LNSKIFAVLNGPCFTYRPALAERGDLVVRRDDELAVADGQADQDVRVLLVRLAER